LGRFVEERRLPASLDSLGATDTAEEREVAGWPGSPVAVELEADIASTRDGAGASALRGRPGGKPCTVVAKPPL
jgi:hypothetical protein